jgi:histidinol phosphatase-like PHP family hydrolase
MHTAETSQCASVSAAEQVRIYTELGYTGIIVTDHFITGNFCVSKLSRKSWEEKVYKFARGYEAAKKAGDACGLDVFLGWEASFNGIHILTYGLGIEFLLANPYICKLNLREYCNLIRANGGYVAQAHPFRKILKLKRIPVNPTLIDGIEAYNSKRSDKANMKAIEYAKQHDLPVQAGTDSHKPDRPFYSGIKMAHKAKSISDIINAIKAREVELITPVV